MQKLLDPTYLHCYRKPVRITTFFLVISLKFLVAFSRKLCHFNPLNSELTPICHLLALLGAHHILHISRIRVRVSQQN